VEPIPEGRVAKSATILEERVELERHEAKYLIHPSLVPEIREFIRPFCKADPNAQCDPPEYVVTTLQLDSDTMTLHLAKEREALNRFKLRCRVYGESDNGPVFLEIKRKIMGMVVKSRVTIPREQWGPELFNKPLLEGLFKKPRDLSNFAEFSRLVHAIAARPVMLIRYHRESYLGTQEHYARLTFDRRLCYCPARGWELPPRDVRWRVMDSAMTFNRPFSAVILELKTFRNAPVWMADLTERFSLERVGFCKYSAAMRLESLFQGAMYSDASENCTYTTVGLP
jgi:hypothetical protein